MTKKAFDKIAEGLRSSEMARPKKAVKEEKPLDAKKILREEKKIRDAEPKDPPVAQRVRYTGDPDAPDMPPVWSKEAHDRGYAFDGDKVEEMKDKLQAARRQRAENVVITPVRGQANFQPGRESGTNELPKPSGEPVE
jgi:cytochrome c556